MKGYVLMIALLAVGLIEATGQVGATFTTVPVVNGKVVFEQFILADQEHSSGQEYAALQKWIKSKYVGNPSVSGVRFDDKKQSVTVSAKKELDLGNGKTIMNYRFDISIANAGCVLVVRDISYQDGVKVAGASIPKIQPAEQTISDSAITVSGSEGDKRTAIRKATLSFVNNLYKEVANLF